MGSKGSVHICNHFCYCCETPDHYDFIVSIIDFFLSNSDPSVEYFLCKLRFLCSWAHYSQHICNLFLGKRKPESYTMWQDSMVHICMASCLKTWKRSGSKIILWQTTGWLNCSQWMLSKQHLQMSHSYYSVPFQLGLPL